MAAHVCRLLLELACCAHHVSASDPVIASSHTLLWSIIPAIVHTYMHSLLKEVSASMYACLFTVDHALLRESFKELTQITIRLLVRTCFVGLIMCA